jgi:translation initiation factor 5A
MNNVFIYEHISPLIAMSWTQAEVRELKVNRYVLVDDEPCKIVSISTSKPGKHGEAKARIEAIGIFDGQKRSIVHPVKHKVQVPMIDKRKGQVLSIMGEEVQIMDLDTYDTFMLPMPDEYKNQIEAGQEIMYLEAMGRRMITRV